MALQLANRVSCPHCGKGLLNQIGEKNLFCTNCLTEGVIRKDVYVVSTPTSSGGLTQAGTYPVPNGITVLKHTPKPKKVAMFI